MRKIAVSLIILILVMVWGCEKPIDIEAEKAAIKDVILAETKASVELKSFEEIAKTWGHKPYSRRVAASNDGYSDYLGWDTISAGFKRWVNENPEPGEPKLKENFIFRVWDKGAWVMSEEYTESEKAEDPSYIPRLTFHVLEKTEEGWKIIFLGQILRDSYPNADTE